MPVGNGRLGAMVFGRPAQERLQLNEDTLYAGGPYRFDNPEFKAALPRVRVDERQLAVVLDVAGRAQLAGAALK